MVEYTIWDTKVNIEIPKSNFPTEEEIKAIDHILGPCTHGFFQSPNHGYKLHYRKFLPTDEVTQPKGVFVYQHGIKAEGGMTCQVDGKVYKTSVLSTLLPKAGYIFYSLDMLGHGFSEGHRFYIPKGDYTINRDDLASFTKYVSQQENSDLPLFLGGESYGGCLTLQVARKFSDEPLFCPSNFKGVCLFAPAIIGDVPSYPVVLALSALAKVYPTWIPFFMPNPVPPERVWRNEQVRAEFLSSKRKRMALDASGDKFCLGTGLGLLNALENVRDKAIPGLTVPFFVAHGTHDFGVPLSGTEYLLKNASTPEENRCARIIEGGYHDIFSEDDREETAMAMINWMNTQSQK